MTTAVWVILCVLGLMTGFALGWSRRHRRAEATTSPAPTRTPTPAPPATEVEPEHQVEVETHAAPVIDLRVLPGEGAAETTMTRPTTADEPESDDEPSAPRLSLAGPGGTAVVDRHRTEQPDAQVIDLVAATRQIPLHNLQFIDGLGPRLDKRLRANGIVTVTDLAAVRRKELRRLLSAHLPSGDADADRFRANARALVADAELGRVAPADPGTELRRVQGIGTTMMRWLETKGITTLAQLAQLTKADIARLEDDLADYPGRIRAEKWRGQARRLVD